MDEKLLDEYKKLVFKREKLRKDAQMYWIDYIMEFGELIEKECALKIDCIKLKKMIAFCQARKNRGETIFRAELDLYIESVMKDYNTELQTIADIRNAKKRNRFRNRLLQTEKVIPSTCDNVTPGFTPRIIRARRNSNSLGTHIKRI